MPGIGFVKGEPARPWTELRMSDPRPDEILQEGGAAQGQEAAYGGRRLSHVSDVGPRRLSSQKCQGKTRISVGFLDVMPVVT